MSDINNLYKFLALFGGNSAKQNLNNIDNSAGIGNGDGVLIKAEFDRAVTGNWDIITGNGWNGEATNKKDLIDKWWASLDVNHSNRKIAGSDITEVNALSGKELDRIDSLAQDFDWEASRADTNYDVGSVDDIDNNPENNLTKLYDEAVLHYKNIEVIKNLCNEELYEKVMKDVKTLYSVIQVSVSQNLKDCVSNGAIEYDKLDTCVLSAIKEKFSLQNTDEIPETVEEPEEPETVEEPEEPETVEKQYILNFQSNYTLTQGESVTNEFGITDDEGNAVTYSKLVFSGFEPLSVGQNGSNTFCIGKTSDAEPGTYTGTVTVTIDDKEYTKTITIIVKEQPGIKDLKEKDTNIDSEDLSLSEITEFGDKISFNEIEGFTNQLKSQILELFKAQCQKAGVSFDKVEYLFENTFNTAQSLLLLIVLAEKPIANFYQNQDLYTKQELCEKFIETFNQLMTTSLTEMNKSNTDMDFQDLDYSGAKDILGDDGYNSFIHGGDIENTNENDVLWGAYPDDDRKDYKEKTKKIIEKLKTQIRNKAEAACKANGIEFDQNAFDTRFNNAMDAVLIDNNFPVSYTQTTLGTVHWTTTKFNPGAIVNDFLKEFNTSYMKWINKQK